MTILYTHPACFEHDTGAHHPERPARLAAVLKALEGEAFLSLEWREAPLASMDRLALVHSPQYVERLLASIPAKGAVMLDPDTVVSPGSGEAALRAAGAVVAGVDAVMGGEAASVFCAVRPPGHHAERDRAMGFCLFNNVAIGALHAMRVHGCRRVAVVDFDVHHGNGTQHMFEEDANLMYASSHQYPYYPGTGAAGERGIGNIVNAPLPEGAGGADFRKAYERTILPALNRFAPEFLLISAGFDAHAADPLAGLALHEDDYAWVTRELLAVARKHAGGRVVSTLEGGYDLEALASSAVAHVRELMAA